MTNLSVNINKVALIRNSRNSNMPDIVRVALDCERYGAQGITVHPRPDERHIRFSDIPELKKQITTELNVEGYPSEEFLQLVKENRPAQVTLVPDKPDQLTSDSGWDTQKEKALLTEVISELKAAGIRVSVFVYPIEKDIVGAKECMSDRVELYTGPYAKHFFRDKKEAVSSYVSAAKIADDLGLGVNAGHDLNLDNLQFFKKNVSPLHEVSIGHALVCDALYLGLQTTIKSYLDRLA